MPQDKRYQNFFYVDSYAEINVFMAGMFEQQVNKDGMVDDQQGNGCHSLALILSHLRPPYTIVVEDYHVDREFRDSFYLHFSSQHFHIDRFCRRLAFFKGKVDFDMFCRKDMREKIQEEYIGCTVVRPLFRKEVGKTLLDPNKYYEPETDIFVRLGNYKTTILGQKLNVCCFPYSTQDGETTRCTDVTLLNILDYYSQSYADYHRAYPSEIVEYSKQNGYERILPAKGMNHRNLSRIITDYGFYPRFYVLNDESQLKNLMYYYSESGVPTVIGLQSSEPNKDGHTLICIGHSKKDVNIDARLTAFFAEQERLYDLDKKKVADEAKALEEIRKKHGDKPLPDIELPEDPREKLYIYNAADFYEYFIVMDDANYPYAERHYKSLSPLPGQELYSLTAPLYRRMYLDGLDSEAIFDEILSSEEFGLHKFVEKPDGPEHEKLVVIKRIFLTSGRSYKNFKLESIPETNRKMREILTSLPLPHFIWVCELYTQEDYDRPTPTAFGELILDATSSPVKRLSSLLYLRYWDRLAFRFPQGDISEIMKQMQKSGYRIKPEKQTGYNDNLEHVPRSRNMTTHEAKPPMQS